MQPNADALGAYAYNENQWVGYDDEEIVRKKSQFVVEHKLGGIMFWYVFDKLQKKVWILMRFTNVGQ